MLSQILMQRTFFPVVVEQSYVEQTHVIHVFSFQERMLNPEEPTNNTVVYIKSL